MMTQLLKLIKAHPIITTLILLIIGFLATGSVFLIIQENKIQRRKICKEIIDILATQQDHNCE